MGYHIYGSYIYYEINLPQFHYYGVHKVGPDFDWDMLTTIGKNRMMKIIMNPTIHFITRKGLYKAG